MINDWLAMAEEEGGERDENNTLASDGAADKGRVAQKCRRGFVKEQKREVIIERGEEGWIEMKSISRQKGD